MLAYSWFLIDGNFCIFFSTSFCGGFFLIIIIAILYNKEPLFRSSSLFLHLFF